MYIKVDICNNPRRAYIIMMAHFASRNFKHLILRDFPGVGLLLLIVARQDPRRRSTSSLVVCSCIVVRRIPAFPDDYFRDQRPAFPHDMFHRSAFFCLAGTVSCVPVVQAKQVSGFQDLANLECKWHKTS